ncbi:cationic peroxidase 1-like [Nymphaea colorata]|nr:cationic peroxidase 1-like [Nymphaea colorata]
MANYSSLLSFFVLLLCACNGVSASLSKTHYHSTCPLAFSVIKNVVVEAVKKEARMGASLLRLHFHDCFVNGCDASVLLDDVAGKIKGEKTAPPNDMSLRGFDVVDTIKANVEKVCPGVVSCADILAVAARDSVVALGGPTWDVRVGRRDSTNASYDGAIANLPDPNSSISTLIEKFRNQKLTRVDLVALSGAHTIGLARCVRFRERLYNDSDIDPSFKQSLEAGCPLSGNDNKDFPLDVATPTLFDNQYYKNLQQEKGLLHSDQVLLNSSITSHFVNRYTSSSTRFFRAFAKAMIKMGNVSPLTGKKGEIRLNCRKVNG